MANVGVREIARAHEVRRGLNFSIPEDAWLDSAEDIEDESGRRVTLRSRLHASIAINGVDFHCEAIEAHIDAHGMFEAKDPYWGDRLSEFHAAAGGEGPMETMEIGGREYAVFLSPFCT